MAYQAAAQALSVDGVVHDLNDVFQTIGEAAYLLSSDPQWSSVAALLDRAVERGRSITHGLVQHPVVSCELEDIADCAVQFAADVLHALQVPGVEFCRDIEPGIKLRGAPGCWERVLLNLLVNAGESMTQGGIVELCARTVDDEVEITVADNGPGIPPGILPLVFRPNFSTRKRGSGMGLHIVESIVRRNGGRVVAGNRTAASGAEFRITVPA